MKHLYRHLIVFCSLVVLSACATQQQRVVESGAKKLSGEEMRDLLVGNKVSGRSASGGYWNAAYESDGTLGIRWNGGGTKGTWYLKDGRFCNRFEFRGNKEECKTTYEVDDNRYQTFNSDGSLSSSWSVQ